MMKKLRLDLDAVAVVSFELDPASGADRGTVEGRQDSGFCYTNKCRTMYDSCDGRTCTSCGYDTVAPQNTCWSGCGTYYCPSHFMATC